MEHDEQVLFFKLLELYSGRHECFDYIFAIPNGGHRHIRTAVYMKEEGTKSGVPDICVPYPSLGYNGMYIEMKYGKGKPSDNQKKYLAYLESVGYKCIVCYSARNAFLSLLDYLRLDFGKEIQFN